MPFIVCCCSAHLSRIKLGEFQYIHNHWPENCTVFAGNYVSLLEVGVAKGDYSEALLVVYLFSVNGSEDIALFPNDQAVITSVRKLDSEPQTTNPGLPLLGCNHTT